MTETITAPPARRALTAEQLATEAIARFGEDPRNWAFRCPTCGDIATGKDFPPGQRSRVAAECVGLHVEGRGCQRTAAAGIIPGPWLIELEDGTVLPSFPLADAPPQTPQKAVHDSPGTPGPERAERPPAPPTVPACTLRLERGAPPMRISRPDGEFVLDLDRWTYRVALTPDHSILGYRDIDDARLCTIFADPTTALFGAFLPLDEQLPAVLKHIAEYGLPITGAEIAAARFLIVEACVQDTAAPSAPSMPTPSAEYLTGPQGKYWTAEDGWAEDHVYGCSCHLSAPCVRCESLDVCEHCETEVLVPAADMCAHLDTVHPEVEHHAEEA